MKLNKYLLMGVAALGLGATSCVGDLDLEPIDPNFVTDTSSEEFYENALGECYSILAVSGQDGPGSAIISGLDNGLSQYIRTLFTMNELTTDEALWMYNENGLWELDRCTYNSSNTTLLGTYGRIYAHIAVCNQFISLISDDASDYMLQMRDEARALRALSYYWVIDIFGGASFTIDAPDGVTEPGQISRPELYAWLEQELVYLVDNSYLPSTPIYGRVGKDGVEALLARLYLNAEVYSGTAAWDKCAQRCQNLINRHKGGGYNNSGLAWSYLGLFANNNHQFAPGGSNSYENEILWTVAYSQEYTQTYGGTAFLINSQVNGDYEGKASVNTNNAWGCLKAKNLLTLRFLNGEPAQDKRFSMWIGGEDLEFEGQKDPVTFTVENTKLGEWKNGYTVIKWTNFDLLPDNTLDVKNTMQVPASDFSNTDFAFFRLAEVYLSYAECYLHGAASTNATDALSYVNNVRGRANVTPWGTNDLTLTNLLDERSRELYWELTRRSDLIRNKVYTGANQLIWDQKNGVETGGPIDAKYELMPIPTNIIAAQPYFVQNPGW